MDQAQIDKALQLCAVLEVQALGDIAKKVQDKQPLTLSDLRLIQQTKAGLSERQEPEPLPAAVDTPVVSYPKALLAWVDATECARAIGVTPRWIQLWIRGSKQCTPKLDSRLKAGRAHVQVGPAYAHIVRHCRRYPAGLHEPSGYRKPGAGVKVDFTSLGEPHEILKKMLGDKELFDELTPEQWRVVISAAQETRNKDKADLDAKRLLPPEDAIRMLQSLRLVFVEHVQDVAAARLSHSLERYILKIFNVDLRKLNPCAQQLLEVPILEDANKTLKALEENVQEQIAGIQKLEGVE